MGYYDETDLYDENQNNHKRHKRSRRGGYPLVTGFIGAIIGAVTISIVSPDIFNLTNKPNLSNETTPVPTQVINVSREDLTTTIQNARKFVVGVNNYQSSNPFSMETEEAGSGSGVVYKKVGNKALIATNNHVVAGAKQLKVKMADGQLIDAKLVGTDELLDLAVVVIDAKYVANIAKLGDSEKINVGETAIAIGNPLGFLESTVTQGIVSSKAREIPQDIDGDGVADYQTQVIQTDAAINPGNSGGALINAKGEVIGINSSKIAEQAVEGIGFAIPMNIAKPALDQIEKFGEVTRPVMGVGLKSLEEIPQFNIEENLKLPGSVTKGAVVTHVDPNTPAAKVGMKQLDVIVALDDKPVSNVISIREYLYSNKKVGDKLKITYYRDGKLKDTTLTLASSQ
ncbi:S1C family serine protease [Bacillus sp. AFS041924]|uniref:S1C family serine protease n=1 Tax=Bacillus sp. AFS041924 TaxID=2033503 RepID=UPI000BFB85E0|nr:trypsin-like peptidase domain-containing protein [Bacillus sp. AFS041924]PGS53496.1 serine protease [Bacillus sp. AFS041924]